MTFFVNIIKHHLFKNLTLSILPIVYTIMFAVTSVNGSSIVLVIGIFIALIHIIEIIGYCLYDNEHKNDAINNSVDVYKQKLEAIDGLCNEAEKIIALNADYLYDFIKQHKDHSIVKDIHFLQERADRICDAVFRYIISTAKSGQFFAVSIMFMEKRVIRSADGTESIRKYYQMIGRKSNYSISSPKSLRNFITEEEAKDYYYKKIFDESKHSYRILPKKKDIDREFKNSKDLDYSQYVGIPIFCKDRIIAILQIVAYDNSVISREKKELRSICDNYLTTFANLFLLSDKIENTKQLVDIEERDPS